MEGKGDKTGMAGDFAWGNGRTMQCADDILLNFTPKTCMVLETNVTTINSIKERFIFTFYEGTLG